MFKNSPLKISNKRETANFDRSKLHLAAKSNQKTINIIATMIRNSPKRKSLPPSKSMVFSQAFRTTMLNNISTTQKKIGNTEPAELEPKQVAKPKTDQKQQQTRKPVPPS